MYKTVFENENLIVVSKEQGVLTEPDGKGEESLIETVKRDFDIGDICLCHRLDRNTGGLLILAKNAETYEKVCSLMDSKDIRKTYAALCFGAFANEKKDRDGFVTKKAFHFKDAKKGLVYVYDFPKKFSKEIVTRYRVASFDKEKNVSRLEITLVTGRTHQIRAHMAHLGHPVCGDGKYGSNRENRALKLKYQALYAVKLEFSPKAREILGTPDRLAVTAEFV